MVSSLYAQLASFFFLWAAIFSDILLIRITLILGNALLIVQGATGIPKWPFFSNAPNVAIDVIVWASLALCLHVWALTWLVTDELAVKRFELDDTESLYQFFHRRSGIGRRDFLRILSKGFWTNVKTAGTSIPTDTDFHLIIDGTISCAITGLRRREGDVGSEEAQANVNVKLGSGDLFDLRLANVFRSPVGFFNSSFDATSACDDVLLFSWRFDDLKALAENPVTLQAWRCVVVFCVSDIAQRQHFGERPCIRRHADFHIPPSDAENKSIFNQIRDVLKWICRSMNPTPPRGLRHRPIPTLTLECDTLMLRDPRFAHEA